MSDPEQSRKMLMMNATNDWRMTLIFLLHSAPHLSLFSFSVTSWLKLLKESPLE